MVTMLNSHIYDAFKIAKVPEKEARVAAESVTPTNELATKDDLNRFATKDDLKRSATKQGLSELKSDLDRLAEKAATKEDLKRFATKEDLNRFATKDDLSGLKNDLDRLADKSVTKDDLNRFATKDDLNHLAGKMNSMENSLGNRITALETSQKILMWMIGIATALMVTTTKWSFIVEHFLQ